MKKELVLRKIFIKDVFFGGRTEIIDNVLRINREELVLYLLEDHHLQLVDIQIAKPGEKKRIIPVKDVLEPRANKDCNRFGRVKQLGSDHNLIIM